MEQTIKKLKYEFNLIKDKKWIKGISNGLGNGGRTFEYLVGKRDIDMFPVPDYYGIEIKTQRANCKYFITLFSCNPDGNEIFEIKRIVNLYGYPHPKIKSSKILNGNVYANKKNFIGMKYQFKLHIDYNSEIIYLHIFDKYGNLVDSNSYWPFELLEERLNMKLKYLAFINVKSRYINKEEYFYYHNITFYKLKNFKKFLDLIEDGTINIHIKIGIHKEKSRLGQMKNHGTGFEIKESDLIKLYDKIDI